jgi:hypothetical protein
VRARLPRESEAWCREHADTVIAGLTERGVDVVGDLADLVPASSSFAGSAQAVGSEDVAEAAVAALAALLEQRIARRSGAPGPSAGASATSRSGGPVRRVARRILG